MEKRLFLIGPGGAGKSTIAPLLAKLLGYTCIDLDDVFCSRIDNIRKFIDKKGYESYLVSNSLLCREIVEQADQDTQVIVLSSGFLATGIRVDLVNYNRQLVANNGKSILLLPSENLSITRDCIV